MLKRDRFLSLRDGHMVMVSSNYNNFSSRTYNVIGPTSASNFVPILVPEGDTIASYSIDEQGSAWGIDTLKYKGRAFLRIPIEEITSSTIP